MDYPLTAIISDLHGNVPAVELAIRDACERGARRFVCLGDVVGYGARPRACLDMVMQICVPGARQWKDGGALEDGLCLRGNHEDALLNSAEDFNPKARAAIEWTRDEINRAEPRERSYVYWDFLSELMAKECDEVAMFAHGSPREPVREYMLPRDMIDRGKMEANFNCMERDVCFIGHSHVPAVYYDDERFYQPTQTEGPYDLALEKGKKAIVNVGSVGQPRDADPRLSYALFDGRSLWFVRLEYDHSRAADEIRAIPELPDYLADRLAVGR
ncbi:MAG: metallophosphoesterase family protein [Planctomycetota bacterium]|nr:metallophosphoesterase family protein [Planctomycetota bacterium]MDP6540887.1 metallophosphoesterase family protein [Planctomycetota bacterium]